MKSLPERAYADLIDAARERDRLARAVNHNRELARQAAKKLLLMLPHADRRRVCDEAMLLAGDAEET